MKLMTKILTISLVLLLSTVNTVTASIPKTTKVSDNDTTPGYLNGKLVQGSGITFTENTDGGDETLTLAVSSVPSSGINWSSVSGAINSSALNWTNINGLAPIQSGGVNWLSMNGAIQRGGLNWNSVLASDIPTLNQNTTGTAANISGTPALPNGTTATTQTQGDGSTKLATTAYVDTGLSGKQAAGTYVSSVSATAPVLSSGGTTPAISMNWSGISQLLQTGAINWSSVKNLEIQKAGINWSSLDNSVQSSGINWSSLSEDIQANGVNWSSLSKKIQNSGINWDSLFGDIQTGAVNWASVKSGELQRSGINWDTFWVDSASFNWAAIPGSATSYILTKTATGVNWSSAPAGAGTVTAVTGAAPITSSGGTTPEIGMNWSSITDFSNGYVLQGVTGGNVKFTSPGAASVNWSEIVNGEVQMAGINWLNFHLDNAGYNWSTIPGAANGAVWQKTATGANWTSTANINVTGTASNVTGTVTVAKGGTNATSFNPNKILMTDGAGTAFVEATAGTNYIAPSANAVQSTHINWSSLSSSVPSAGMNWANIGNQQADYGLTGLSTTGVNWVPRKFSFSIPLSSPNSITGKDKMIVFTNDSGYPITIDKIRAEASASSNWSLFKAGVGTFNWTNLTGTSINWDNITTLHSVVCSTANNAPTSGVNWTSFATTTPTAATIENLTHIGVNWTAGSPNWANTKIEGHYN